MSVFKCLSSTRDEADAPWSHTSISSLVSIKENVSALIKWSHSLIPSIPQTLPSDSAHPIFCASPTITSRDIISLFANTRPHDQWQWVFHSKIKLLWPHYYWVRGVLLSRESRTERPSYLWLTLDVLEKPRVKFNLQILPTPLGGINPCTIQSPSVPLSKTESVTDVTVSALD